MGFALKDTAEATTEAAEVEIGLLALATDHAIEAELRRFLGSAPASVYTTRMPFAERYDVGTLQQTCAALGAATALLVPGSRLDVVAYGCTSGTVAIGEERIFAEIRAVRPEVACTTPMTAALAALRALGVRRLALLTPYIAPVHAIVAAAFAGAGLTVVDQVGLGVEADSEITRVPAGRLRDAVGKLAWRESDAVFLSCTSLLTASFLAGLDAELGRPVLASNQALAWHCLRLAGSDASASGKGALFRRQRCWRSPGGTEGARQVE